MKLTNRQIAEGFYLGYSRIDLSSGNWQGMKNAFQDKREISVEEAKKQLKEKLCGVISRMMPPVAVCHSGGVDSTLMLCLVRECFEDRDIGIYRAGFTENDYNEVGLSNEIIKGMKWVKHAAWLNVDAEKIKWLVSRIREYNYRTWFYSSSLIATAPLYAYCSNSNNSILTGDGGDEVFCGYDRYLLDYYFDNVGANLLLPFIDKDSRRGKKLRDYIDIGYEGLVRLWPEKLLFDLFGCLALYNQSFGERCAEVADIPGMMHKLDRLMLLDIGTELFGVEKQKVDAAAKIAGASVTSPLMDFDVMKFCAALPVNMKYRWFTRKWLLREIIKDYIPDFNSMSKKKRGFAVPISQWFRKDLNTWLWSQLKDNLYGLDRATVNDLMIEHVGGKADHGEKIWSILMWVVLNRKGIIER